MNTQTHLTKQKYMLMNNNSLSRAMSNNNWPAKTPIQIVEGVHNTINPNSNLKKALDQSKLNRYIVGPVKSYRKHCKTFIFAIA